MKSNTFIVVTVTVLILAGAYWYFVVDAGNQSTLTSTGAPSAAQTQFDALVSELTPISFDTSIFSDPRFNALVDITTPIAQESAGRVDPLATFSASVSTAASAQPASDGTLSSTPSAAPSTTGTQKPGN